MKKSTKIAVSAPEPQSHGGADGLMTDKAAQAKIAALRAKDQKYHKASKRLTVVAASLRIAPPLARFAVKKASARAVKASKRAHQRSTHRRGAHRRIRPDAAQSGHCADCGAASPIS